MLNLDFWNVSVSEEEEMETVEMLVAECVSLLVLSRFPHSAGSWIAYQEKRIRHPSD
jgi:hypothetical protein